MIHTDKHRARGHPRLERAASEVAQVNEELVAARTARWAMVCGLSPTSEQIRNRGDAESSPESVLERILLINFAVRDANGDGKWG